MKHDMAANKKLFSVLREFSAYLLILCIIYSELLSNQLVNQFDGLWHRDEYQAGKWEVSIGRWFWPELDKYRFAMNLDPFTSITAIMIFIAAFMLIMELFDIRFWLYRAMVCVLFGGSVSVCVALSYRYMSHIFACSYLFSVLAVWVIERDLFRARWMNVVVSSVLIAHVLGLYQSNIGTYLLLCLTLFMMHLYRCDSAKSTALLFADYALAALIGMLLYYVMMKQHLALYHVQISDYNNADGVSVSAIISNLLPGAKRSVKEFLRFFRKSDLHYSLMEGSRKLKAAYYICLIAGLITFADLIRKSVPRALLYLASAVLIPAAANFCLLLVPGSGIQIQMTTPMATLLPLLFCLLYQFLGTHRTAGTGRVCFVLTCLLMLHLLYGTVAMTLDDQGAMDQGMQATRSLAASIDSSVISQGESLTGEREVAVIGKPAGNRQFFASALFQNANAYARFGDCKPNLTKHFWRGFYRHCMNVNFNSASTDRYRKLQKNQEVAAMPCYPDPGSIRIIDGTLVVKVSG